MDEPELGQLVVCHSCKAVDTIDLVLTFSEDDGEGEVVDMGFECTACGAPYIRMSDKGPYDALDDLVGLIVEEGLNPNKLEANVNDL